MKTDTILLTTGAVIVGGLRDVEPRVLPPVPGGDDIPDSMIDTAISVMVHAHRNQKRFGGEPYRIHPEAVAAKLPRALKPLGLLHDVMEDNPEEYPLSRLQTLFPAWVTERIVILSKAEGQEYDEFILRTREDEATRKTKIADILDNLKDLKHGSLRDKYRLALRLLATPANRFNPPTRESV